MAYRDDIIALGPDHLWEFDGDLNDSVGTLDGTNTGFDTISLPICQDANVGIASNGTADRVSVSSSAEVNGELDRKAVCGWIRLSSIQLPPKSIYREGTTGNQFNLVMWAGNNLMLDVVNGSSIIQVFSDRVLRPGRNYHVFARVVGTGFGDAVELYIDGVKASISSPAVPALGAATLGSRAAAEWGDPSGATEVGNATVLLNAPTNCNYNYWASFSGANAQLSDTQIRGTLFEAGALPEVDLGDGTQAVLQSALDSLSGFSFSDSPLTIRIGAVAGDGDLSLTADNVVFDSLASVDVQYMGSGTLTWTNINGSNASIGSAPNGGSVNFVNPATLTVAPLIAGTEVRVYEAGTENEVAGTESSGTSFVTSVNVNSVDVQVISIDFQNIRVEGVDMTGGDVDLPIQQIFDRQYENP